MLRYRKQQSATASHAAALFSKIQSPLLSVFLAVRTVHTIGIPIFYTRIYIHSPVLLYSFADFKIFQKKTSKFKIQNSNTKFTHQRWRKIRLISVFRCRNFSTSSGTKKNTFNKKKSPSLSASQLCSQQSIYNREGREKNAGADLV